MNRAELRRIIIGIEESAREAMLRDFRPDCCIATTRAVIRVLKYYGIEAKPLPVKVTIYNKAYTDLLGAGEKPPEDPEQLIAWCAKTGAWSVGLGEATDDDDPRNDRQPNRWPGHLVAVIPNEKILIDASLSQATRPQHGIFLPPVMVLSNLTPEFLRGESSCGLGSSDGQAMFYVAYPQQGGFQKARDWTDATRTKRAMKTIIRHINETEAA